MTTTRAPYRDPGASVDERVADLLPRMTRAEKLAQIGSFWAFEVVGDDGLDRVRLAALAEDGLGELTRLAGSTNLRPAEVAATANAIQRFLVEETRLGIPAIIHEECLHGLLAWAAPCFQQSIGAAAAFDTAHRRRRRLDHPPPDADDRRAPRPGSRPRHRARPALGPDRGDLRRRPVPRRGAGLRVRHGPPGSVASSTGSWPPASTWSGTAWPRAA